MPCKRNFSGFHSRNTSLLLKAFMCYVRPILEYASEVWSPYLLQDIHLIESVQRDVTRHLPNMKGSNYPQRLKLLGIESLESRRIRADLLLCFKIVNNFVDLKFEDFLVYSLAQRTRGHSKKLNLPIRKTDIRAQNFSIRVIPYWNELPQSVVDSQTVSALM